jgi:hypothetical protein
MLLLLTLDKKYNTRVAFSDVVFIPGFLKSVTWLTHTEHDDLISLLSFLKKGRWTKKYINVGLYIFGVAFTNLWSAY